MTQSGVGREEGCGYSTDVVPGHFRLGRLNGGAGVCGGRGDYGYGIDKAELYRYNNDRTLKPPYHRQQMDR